MADGDNFTKAVSVYICFSILLRAIQLRLMSVLSKKTIVPSQSKRTMCLATKTSSMSNRTNETMWPVAYSYHMSGKAVYDKHSN